MTFFTARLGKFHNWEKANKIAKEFSFGFSGLPIVYYRVYFDDTLLDLGFGIRGYYGVLGDVVHLVQKANPRAVIDPKVLEKIKDSI